MDKVTCLAFILYQSSHCQEMKERAIELLNGDVTLQELKKSPAFRSLISQAESQFKKKKIDLLKVQKFAEEFMLIEV